jgi:hypothetical protein
MGETAFGRSSFRRARVSRRRSRRVIAARRQRAPSVAATGVILLAMDDALPPSATPRLTALGRAVPAGKAAQRGTVDALARSATSSIEAHTKG